MFPHFEKIPSLLAAKKLTGFSIHIMPIICPAIRAIYIEYISSLKKEQFICLMHLFFYFKECVPFNGAHSAQLSNTFCDIYEFCLFVLDTLKSSQFHEKAFFLLKLVSKSLYIVVEMFYCRHERFF